MAVDPGTKSIYIRVNYPSHNEEIPVAFLVHNKGLFNSFLIQEYFFICPNEVIQSGSMSMSCYSSYITTTQARFYCSFLSDVSVSNGIEIAPIYISDLGLT